MKQRLHGEPKKPILVYSYKTSNTETIYESIVKCMAQQ